MRMEIRNDSVVIDGYVNAVERDSCFIPSVRGKFKERIAPGAFQRSLDKAKNVDLLLNHDKNRKLGSTSEGNLELFEDNIGLRAICTINDPEVIEKARNNKLRGWSFGFYTNKDKWEEADGFQRRTVEDLDIFEVTIVDNTKLPAYIGTSIEVREEQNILTETRGNDFSNLKIDTIENSKEERTIDFSVYEEEINNIARRR